MALLRSKSALFGTLCIAVASNAVLSSCTGQKPAAAQSQESAAAPAAADESIPDVLATIGDDKITMADIRARAGDDLDQMEVRYQRNRHKLIENKLQEILHERVLLTEAKKQGKTVDQLVESEIGTSLEPSDADIQKWYQENRSRTSGRALDQIRSQIADYLRKQRRDQAAEKLDQRLNQERDVKILLEPFRVTFNNEGAPATGPASAPVTLVEFSDFQCPFCGRFYPTLKELEKNFGDKLRIVYRQYPITNLHPNAFKAAEASLCAADQGKFWELHDLMFQDQSRLAVKDLKVAAGRLGLNQKKFDTCLDTGQHTERVQTDIAEGNKVGVTGTPALFLNGVPLEGGSVPYETVAKAIEKVLAKPSK